MMKNVFFLLFLSITIKLSYSDNHEKEKKFLNYFDDEVAMNEKTTKVACWPAERQPGEVPTVEIVNSTELFYLMNFTSDVTSLEMNATCLVVFFYSPTCPFSCKAAPFYNAFARVYPNLKMVALDTTISFKTAHSVTNVPSIHLFHNGHSFATYSDKVDYSLLGLLLFVQIKSGLLPVLGVTNTVREEDHIGPVPSKVLKQTDNDSQAQNGTNKVACWIIDPPPDQVPTVEIVNSTQLVSLMNVTSNVTSLQTDATCLLVFFYSPSCPYSCKAAPYYNAFARIYPSLKMVALDTSSRNNFNAHYGIVGVPSLLLFHNGRPFARFNKTTEYNLHELSEFVQIQSGLLPNLNSPFSMTSADFIGPISSEPIKQTDYCLILSWVFIILCAIYFFYYSSWCQLLVDSVKSAWNEAEAQHQHVD